MRFYIKKIYEKIQSTTYVSLFCINTLLTLSPYIFLGNRLNISSFILLYIFFFFFAIIKFEISYHTIKIEKESYVFNLLIFIISNIVALIIFSSFYYIGYNHDFLKNSICLISLAGCLFISLSIDYYGYLLWKKI